MPGSDGLRIWLFWKTFSWRQDASGVRTSPRQRAWALSDPWLSNPTKMRKKYSWVNIAVYPRLQLISHTQPTSTLSRIKCERYIFIKKCVRSFIEVRQYLIIFLHIFVYVCGYTRTVATKKICYAINKGPVNQSTVHKWLKNFSRIERNSTIRPGRVFLPTPPLGQDMTQGQFLSGL